jgi:hypothetical protein
LLAVIVLAGFPPKPIVELLLPVHEEQVPLPPPKVKAPVPFPETVTALACEIANTENRPAAANLINAFILKPHRSQIKNCIRTFS